VIPKDDTMPNYLIAIYHPEEPPIGPLGDPEAIATLNREMVTAGVRKFVAGLKPAQTAQSVLKDPSGNLIVTDGPYIESKEHVGGFWVLELASQEEALAWGRKAAIACRAPVEVRAFN